MTVASPAHRRSHTELIKQFPLFMRVAYKDHEIPNERGRNRRGTMRKAFESTCCAFQSHGILSPANFDGFAKSRKTPWFVIPAEAGIQYSYRFMKFLDPVFQRGDDFLRVHQGYYGLHSAR